MNEPKTEMQRQWAEILEEAEASGMSLADYARPHNFAAQTLYQWRSTLQASTASTSAVAKPPFTKVVTPSLPSGLTVELNGARLRFDRLPDVQPHHDATGYRRTISVSVCRSRGFQKVEQWPFINRRTITRTQSIRTGIVRVHQPQTRQAENTLLGTQRVLSVVQKPAAGTI